MKKESARELILQGAEIFCKGRNACVGTRLHVYDRFNNEIGTIKEQLFRLLPVFDIEIGGEVRGSIQKKFSFFKPKYEVDFNGWRCEGDFLAWDYDVYSGCSRVVHISKNGN